VLIGGGCKLWDGDFHGILPSKRQSEDFERGTIIIRKNAWIGGSCTILKNVEIGENAVIATGSVVASNVPANEIWGGIPARFIKQIK